MVKVLIDSGYLFLISRLDVSLGTDKRTDVQKRELGRHAFEERMPERVAVLLAAEDSSNKLNGVVPLLAHILQGKRNLSVAYLCSEHVTQIWKLPGEGNHFCGYRNIQMVVSNMQSRTILGIQEHIERAWDAGFNTHGRVETGGIRGTRKHIGTSELQALLESQNAVCRARIFIGKRAFADLMESIEQHFSQACEPSDATGIIRTAQPPVYLQLPRHSVTVIGFCRTRNSQSLLVFDPGLAAPEQFKKCAGIVRVPGAWFGSLWRYRRGRAYLRRHRRFETLTVLEK